MEKGLRRYTNEQQVHEKMLNITNHLGNANQNHNETSFYTLGWPLFKSKKPRK